MLPFSASLCCVAASGLPWAEPGGRLGAWCARAGAAALVSDGGPQGRYSYLLAEPDATAELGAGDDAAAFLAAATAFVAPGEAPEDSPDLPPFSGGLVGVAAFELGLRLEQLARAPFRIEGGQAWPELVVHRYPGALAFDHHRKTVIAVGRGATPRAAETVRDRLVDLWNATCATQAPAGSLPGSLIDAPLRLETPDPVHEDKVAAVVGQIHAGDLFQANLARGWTGRLRLDRAPADVIAALTAAGPAPFGAFIDMGHNRVVVSNSPERFIRLDRDGTLETRPIKGTRPRGRTPDEDAALARALLASAKDRAENLMIVDLMRHDLAKVARIGSVAVPALNALESYANVHHLVSAVTARLAEGRTAADVLLATLPPGSVSGAPKVQAMKVISAMEAARGPYCGALFTIDAAGAMDSSVLIRTIALEKGRHGWNLRAAAGGGIVADSDPRDERIETETKLSLIRRVLEGA
jgi:para-aminobenzoate synthetase component 1